MKTAITFLGALLFAASAAANPNRYEWRSFGGENVDLQPLFAWWTFASETTNKPLDITDVNADKLAADSNLWEHLPARPLADWSEIQANENGITVVGNMWRVDAIVAPAPMIFKRQMIYLRNPPVREIQNFNLALAEYKALRNGESNQVFAAQLPTGLPTNPATIYFPGTIRSANGRVISTSGGVPAVEQSLAAAAAVSKNIETTDLNRLGALRNYLATFPSPKVYHLDHFALRTGRQIDGLDVYDLGAAAGLNY